MHLKSCYNSICAPAFVPEQICRSNRPSGPFRIYLLNFLANKVVDKRVCRPGKYHRIWCLTILCSYMNCLIKPCIKSISEPILRWHILRPIGCDLRDDFLISNKNTYKRTMKIPNQPTIGKTMVMSDSLHVIREEKGGVIKNLMDKILLLSAHSLSHIRLCQVSIKRNRRRHQRFHWRRVLFFRNNPTEVLTCSNCKNKNTSVCGNDLSQPNISCRQTLGTKFFYRYLIVPSPWISRLIYRLYELIGAFWVFLDTHAGIFETEGIQSVDIRKMMDSNVSERANIFSDEKLSIGKNAKDYLS